MAHKRDLPKPTCLALILCEQVIQDGRTKNLTLVNSFNTIPARIGGPTPHQHTRLAVFVSLTGGHGQNRGKLTIEDAKENEVFHGEGDIVFPNPLAVVEMTFDIRGLPLPCEGNYHIQFWCGDQMLRQRNFQVKATGQQQE